MAVKTLYGSGRDTRFVVALLLPLACNCSGTDSRTSRTLDPHEQDMAEADTTGAVKTDTPEPEAMDATPGTHGEVPDPLGTPDPTTEPTPPILSDACDLPGVVSVVVRNCSSCHANGAALGGVSVADATTWATTTLEANLAVKVMHDGTMPPPGIAPLNADELELVQMCYEDGNAVSRARDDLTSVGQACDAEIQDGAGFMKARLLSSIELRNTLEAIVGTSNMAQLATGLSLVPTGSGSAWFSSETSAATPTFVEALLTLGDAVADVFASQASLRRKLTPCLETLPATVTDSCRDASLKSLAEAFYRRAAGVTEMDDVTQIWDLSASTSTATALTLVVRYLVQSPGFAYLQFSGTPTGDPEVFRLTLTELAERLSYWLWKGPPDAALTAKANDGTLANATTLRSEIQRLWDDPKGAANLKLFIREWLALDSMPSAPSDPTFLDGLSVAGLADEMRDEVIALGEKIILEGGSFEDLMTTRQADLSDRLATIYGATDGGLADLDPNTRAGILTRAALHVRGLQASPFHMAKIVQERVIGCEALPPPPAGVASAVEEGVGTDVVSFREKFERATTEPACIGCHNQLNAWAFGFQYDAIGRFKVTEALVDTSGAAAGESTIDRAVMAFTTRLSDAKPVNGPVELSQFIASSERAQRCFLTQTLRFSEGRKERVYEGCHLERARRNGGIALRAQIFEYLASAAFQTFRFEE